MEDTPIDMLQIKIERAKDELPQETKQAIDAVDWKAFILTLREKKGYSFEQLEDLELETELLLCGLSNPADYPKLLEKSMGLPKSQVDLLVNEMNESVFKKIREELVKNTERKELFVKKTDMPKEPGIEPATLPNIPDFKRPTLENQALSQNKPGFRNEITPARTEDRVKNDLFREKLKKLELPKNQNIPPTAPKDSALQNPVASLPSQKLVGSFQMPTTRTEYSLPSEGKDMPSANSNKLKLSKEDPYRLAPEE